MHKLAACLVLFFILLNHALGSDKLLAFKNSREVSLWIATYYKSPQPERLSAAIHTIASNQSAMSNLFRLDPIIHFFATAARHNTETLESLNSMKQKFSGNSRIFIERISDKATQFKTPAPNDPNDLDMLWSQFFASGDRTPLITIMQTFAFQPGQINLDSKFWTYKGITDKQQALAMLKASAEWSIRNNMRNHPIVMGVVTSFAEGSIESPSGIQSKARQLLVSSTAGGDG